jgi:hypothetical protein
MLKHRRLRAESTHVMWRTPHPYVRIAFFSQVRGPRGRWEEINHECPGDVAPERAGS